MPEMASTEQQRAYAREYYAKNRDKLRREEKVRRQGDPTHPARNRAWRLAAKYGMTPEQRLDMIEQQQNQCAICKTQFGHDQKAIHIDHSHSTGKVRGILCAHCNTGLGKFKDSPAILAAAIEYLQERS